MQHTATIDPLRRRARAGLLLLIAMLSLAAAAKLILHDTLDPDLFWHLRVAQRLAAQSFPHPLIDDLSFSSIRRPWTPYSWLAELGMKSIWDHLGYRGVVAIQGAMAATVVLFLALAAGEMAAGRAGRCMAIAAAT